MTPIIKLILIYFLFTPLYGRTQNLVPNPSFEEVNFDFCGLVPTNEKFEKSIKCWLAPTDARPGIDSKKLHPSCWNYLRVEPKSGNRVAVILAYSYNDFRSYIQTPLREALKTGKTYHTEIFVRVHKGSQSASNNLGLYFSDTLVKEKILTNLNFKPQVNHSEILKDTASWISLKGRFKATSNAKYLIIGNFFNNESTAIEKVRSTPGTSADVIFLLIDDVIVREESNNR